MCESRVIQFVLISIGIWRRHFHIKSWSGSGSETIPRFRQRPAIIRQVHGDKTHPRSGQESSLLGLAPNPRGAWLQCSRNVTQVGTCWRASSSKKLSRKGGSLQWGFLAELFEGVCLLKLPPAFSGEASESAEASQRAVWASWPCRQEGKLLVLAKASCMLEQKESKELTKGKTVDVIFTNMSFSL